jgi:hypothetical protein
VARDWRLGDVLRGTLAARAACLLLRSMAAPAGRQGLPRWAAAAARLPFSAPGDKAEVLGVAAFRRKLADASEALQGQLVQVEGRLEKLLIVHLHQKPVSVGLLTDGNGHSLIVVLPHIKLDSGGAVPGAMVRVAGVYAADALTRHLPTFPAAQAAELEKMPRDGLLVDRLNLAARARLSWLGWVGLPGRAARCSCPCRMHSTCPGAGKAASMGRPTRSATQPGDEGNAMPEQCDCNDEESARDEAIEARDAAQEQADAAQESMNEAQEAAQEAADALHDFEFDDRWYEDPPEDPFHDREDELERLQEAAEAAMQAAADAADAWLEAVEALQAAAEQAEAAQEALDVCLESLETVET